jgi:1,4-alpha-glucan branching enzyme
MDSKGYLILVLHAHMPFIRHPETAATSEENWLFDSLVECYLPVLETFERLAEEGVPYKVTVSLTPPLLEMWADPFLKARFARYLADHAQLAEREMERLAGAPAAFGLARFYRDRFVRTGELFERRWHGDLAAAWRRLAEAGHLEILASAGSHAYLPLWESYPEVVELQIRAGVRRYEQAFGRPPVGFWLPECGYFPELDRRLWNAGLSYTFLDTHGVLHATPRPCRGVQVPVHCPSGLAVFGRDPFCHQRVWDKGIGYPGEPAYLDYDRDIGYELPLAELEPFTRCGHRVPTGLRYHRLGSSAPADFYDPDLARERCQSHADHFVAVCRERLGELHQAAGRGPVLAALFDVEHFGHWWHEGPLWLELALRALADAGETIELTTGAEYLTTYPTHQVVEPHLSSWGYQGYSETWLMARNHWLLPALFRALEELRQIDLAGACAGGTPRAALAQALRELMLAQTSDWPFILNTQTAAPYAARRLESHLGNLAGLLAELRSGAVDPGRLAALEDRHNLFSALDLAGLYQESREALGLL